MEHEKSSYSETSTAESHHNNQPEKPSDDGAARIYDCVFCKRGFTNAQALGGHMNIHRKEKNKAKAKAKAKQKKSHEDPLIQSFNSNSSFYPRIVTADYVDYRVYMPPPNPCLQTVNYEYCFFPVWRADHFEDRIDQNLSLRMGSGEDEEGVDLELRLGRSILL